MQSENSLSGFAEAPPFFEAKPQGTLAVPSLAELPTRTPFTVSRRARVIPSARRDFRAVRHRRRGLQWTNSLRSQGVWEVASLKILKKFVSKFSALRAEIVQIIQILQNLFLSTYNFHIIAHKLFMNN